MPHANLTSQHLSQKVESSTDMGTVKAQYSSVKEYLAKSIMEKELSATAAKTEKANFRRKKMNQ